MARIDSKLRESMLALRRRCRISEQYERLDKAWDRYETAANLASGPDPNRAEYWEHQAKNRLDGLRRIMASLADSLGVEDALIESQKKKKTA